MNTQVEMILDYCKRFGSISNFEAVRRLGVYRLASRIHDIKQLGYTVTTCRETGNNRAGRVVQYARYYISGKENGND